MTAENKRSAKQTSRSKQDVSGQHHEDIVGAVNQGRLGLGVITRARWKDASAKGHRSLVQEELRLAEEEDRQAKAVFMNLQGSWKLYPRKINGL